MVYNCLVTFRSMTHAQKAQRLLAQMGMPTEFTRPPLGLTQDSCGYGLKISERHVEKAVRELVREDMAWGKAFILNKDTYREVLYGIP